MTDGNRTEEMSCKELVELVSDYLEGHLSPEDGARFESHLATCPGCKTYLEQMRLTLAVSGSLEEDALEPAARDQLLEAFRRWKKETRPSE